MPTQTQPYKLELRENRSNMAMCEDKPRFDVVLDGKVTGQLYWNMTGYTGAYLPMPNGRSLEVGERGISAYRQGVAALNREASNR